jgi:predicted ribosomally synthesized peptide with nif11-like leader
LRCQKGLSAFLNKLKDDTGLQEKLKGAADLDAVVAIAKDSGFDIPKADWLKYQAKQPLELSDEELEGVAGGALRVDEELEGLLGRGSKTCFWNDLWGRL